MGSQLTTVGDILGTRQSENCQLPLGHNWTGGSGHVLPQPFDETVDTTLLLGEPGDLAKESEPICVRFGANSPQFGLPFLTKSPAVRLTIPYEEPAVRLAIPHAEPALLRDGLALHPLSARC